VTASSARFRAGAFVIVALAALTGLTSRIAISHTGATEFDGVESLNLSPGQPFGRASFDGILSESVPTVRLKAKQCAEPIYVVPMQLRAVAEPELADRTYLDRVGYSATNVYQGEVRHTFSHLERVLARNPLTPFRLDYFVRFYAPPGCAIDDEAYVEWAGLILAAGTTPQH
jgi:hypothetical protein